MELFTQSVSVLEIQSQDFHDYHGNQTGTKRVHLKIHDTLLSLIAEVCRKNFAGIMHFV